jgi:hypothetical protein
LRSEKGFRKLQECGWIDSKLKEWKENGNEEYNYRIEKAMYEGLDLNNINSVS